MKRQRPKKYHPRVYKEACEWFVEFRTGTPSEPLRGRFHAWLQEAPAHMAAYLDVAASWGHAGALDIAPRFPRDVLIADALGETETLLEYPVSPGAPPESRGRNVRRFPWMPTRLVIAASVAALILAAGWMTWLHEHPTYSTGVGEERSILLSDGSTLNLNARSRVRIHYTARQRGVELLAGQALFRVAKNPNRPFVVSTGSTLVRAVGTEFDVDRRIRETVVTVLEGVVAVADAKSAATSSIGEASPPSSFSGPRLSAIYVSAGEQLTVAPSVSPHPMRVNVANAIAWTHRELVFASTPLSDVVQDFNRYNARQLVITDPALEGFEIDGVFSSTDSTSLIRFLRGRPDIEIRERGDEIAISRR